MAPTFGGAGPVRFARRRDVFLQDPDGGATKHPPACHAHHGLHAGISCQGVDPHLSVCFPGRLGPRLCDVVVSVFVHMDDFVGCGDDIAAEDAEADRDTCLCACERTARTVVWNFVCTGAGGDVEFRL